MDILISGAGIAGPALAFWLRRHGFNPMVIEQAPALRDGGYAVDFRGRVHLDLLARMGVLDAIRSEQTHMGVMSYVDARGRVRSTLPADFMAGDVEILRGDLGRILHAATRDGVEYVFGDSVTTLEQDAQGVDVSFRSGERRRFDLVVGADGLHSKIRRLAFAGDAQAIRPFGYHVAIFTAPNLLGLDRTGVFHNAPGRSAGCYAARDNTEAKVVLTFASGGPMAERLDCARRDRAAQETILTETFAGMGWETPRLLAALPDAPDLYFDAVSQVRLPGWSRGRVTLLGDAAACPSPWSGAGTGLAIVGAYVLAGELKRASDDIPAALAAYEGKVRSYADRAQKMAEGAGDWVAPMESWKLWRRDVLYRTLPLTPWKGMLADIPRKTAEAITLEDY